MEAQKDCLVRAISKDGFVNAVAVYTRGLTERARQIHHTSPVATAALGRALAACSMMGNALKDNGASVTMQIKGDGPLGTILTVSDSEGNVRGYVQNPAVDLALREDGKLDVGTAVGHSGTLTVIKDLNMREPYVGTVDLLGGEIAEDVAAYYVESEQVPSACGLGVLIDRDRSVLTAGGYLIQLLPGAGEDVITKVEGGIYAAPSVTNLLKENSDPAVLLKTVLPLSVPGIISGVTMTFIPAISTFAISELLSNRQIYLFGDSINTKFTVAQNFGVGSVMSLVMLVLVIVANVLVNVVNKEDSVRSTL